jgi:hypothetical protein
VLVWLELRGDSWAVLGDSSSSSRHQQCQLTPRPVCVLLAVQLKPMPEASSKAPVTAACPHWLPAVGLPHAYLDSTGCSVCWRSDLGLAFLQRGPVGYMRACCIYTGEQVGGRHMPVLQAALQVWCLQPTR